ncbi:NAD(P)-binding protein [Epithele typhae]|uniref:NAD(P)-binding protein n=1 Tax=Epithele typhae TaxID=378194 RepID=UPI0020078A16|nr:NAD(P)-binding protein [Epithele typhae]KAH9925389.1 NAD(P)-binding protein [Epithele typhae]
MNASVRADAIFDLKGRVAVVTGGGTGIGLHIATGLAENGAKVYITGRRKEVLDKAASAFAAEHKGNGSMIPLTMDVTSRESIAAARDQIEAADGKLHLLVNNAGQVGPVSPWFEDPNAPQRASADATGRALFADASFDDWAQIYSVNTFSIWFVTTAFLGLLTKGSDDVSGYTSSVVNITSVSGHVKLSQNHASPICAASHLSKMMATEWAVKGIPVRVNAIAPGVWESEMTYDEVTPELVDRIGKGLVPVPTKRAGRPGEMAGTVIYLASPAGCYTNGQEIAVDGGYLAVNPSTV